MKRRLERPAELFVPLALLIPALAGQAGTVAAVAAACALGRLCTSCAAEAFRCAAAQEISPQRVRGAWSGALLATLTLSVAALSYVPRAWVWLLAKPLAQGTWLALWGIGTCLPIARLADGHLRAVGEGGTAALSAFLRAILLAAGAFCGLQWAAGAAAVAAAVALVLACTVGGSPLARPNAAAIACAPTAMWRALSYPLPALLLVAGFWQRGAGWAVAGYLLGMAAYTCVATPFRRQGRENASLHMVLVVPAAIVCAAAPFMPAQARAVAAHMAFAAPMGLAAYAGAALRTLAIGMLLAIAGLLPWLLPAHSAIAAPLCAALALYALQPDMRQAHAARRRRKSPSLRA